MSRNKLKDMAVCTGTESIARAVKRIEPEIIAAYPITPQTEIVEKLSEFARNGEMDSEFITVESEHSAMSACIGGEFAGSRCFTATASQGLLHMSEPVHWAAGARTPIVMAIANRAVGPPWNLWADHTDMMSHRDVGWLQFYAGSNQEAFDFTIMAYKIAENEEVMLPAMVSIDGFTLANTVEPIDMVTKEDVGEFLPPFQTFFDFDEPFTVGGIARPDDYWKFRKDIKDSMESSKDVIKNVFSEFSEKFGGGYSPIMTYRCEDAKILILGTGTLAREAEIAVDELRDEGVKVGIGRLVQYRPFPRREIEKICEGCQRLIIFDRSYSFGYGGVIAGEAKRFIDIPIANVIAGLGGQNITYKDIQKIVKNTPAEEEIWWKSDD